MNTTTTKQVILPVNKQGQACLPHAQYEGRTNVFTAVESTIVVRTPASTFHLGWQEAANAKKFANSIGRDAQVLQVEPYLYVCGYGRV